MDYVWTPPPNYTQPDGDAVTRHVWGLRSYLNSCGLLVYGTRVKRRDVVAYVANKLGGAHFDPERTRKSEKAYVLIDGSFSTFRIQEKNAIYFEILSIGQLVCASPDVATFVGSR